MPTESPPDIRVLLVDGHVLVRAGLRALIDSHDGFTVVGESSDAEATLALVGSAHPDVVLLDLDFGEHAVDFLSQLRFAGNGSRVLLLTAFQNEEVHKQAIRRGAHGIFKKDDPVDSLLKAIRKVHAGELWIDRTMTAELIGSLARGADDYANDPERAKSASLTAREREVITLVGEGLKNKEIAARLFISDTTVRHHLTSIFSKLHVSDRLSLALYASRHGLTPVAK